MTNQSFTHKNKKNNPVQKKPEPIQPNTMADFELPEQMRRIKENEVPQIPSSDVLGLQQGIGNKAFRNLISQRMPTATRLGVQKHSIPGGRKGVGTEDEEIQTRLVDRAIQRHSIPGGRAGVGLEEDEIQSKSAIQMSPAFGRIGSKQPVSSQILWGRGIAANIQRKDGEKTDKATEAKLSAPTDKKGETGKVDEEAEKKADEEYKKFIGGGPVTFPDYVPDKVDNFGKYDVVYDPGKRTLSANMRIKFEFPDMPVPKGSSPAEVINASIIKLKQETYINTFLATVSSGWSGKFNFQNVREPQSIWGKLNPISVKVNVTSVDAKQHFTLKKYFKDVIDPKTGLGKVPAVSSNATSVANMYLFDTTKRGFTGNPNVGKGELARLQRNLPKIHFANSSFAIEGKYIPDLTYIADYLKRMSRPKFNINIVGHASKTGPEPDNIKFSTMRANVVMDKLKAMGVNNHNLTAAGVGSTGATEDGSWRKVDFVASVDKSFSNVQDVDLHEFGHMLGLDDEYTYTGEKRSFNSQKDFIKKMLGNEAYGKGNEEKYATEVSTIQKVNPEQSAGVMYAGNEVRVYNYVTFWKALYDTAAMAANQPTPAFTWKDWKVVG